MQKRTNSFSSFKNILFLFLFCSLSTSIYSKNNSLIFYRYYSDQKDTAKGGAGQILMLDKDEGIKCTRAELTEIEFRTTCTDKYGELLRITYQDLERGGREIIFQKKMILGDEIKFFIPMDFVREAKTAVLVIMKGEGMFFKKIDVTD